MDHIRLVVLLVAVGEAAVKKKKKGQSALCVFDPCGLQKKTKVQRS
jgi:hypothetical protein